MGQRNGLRQFGGSIGLVGIFSKIVSSLHQDIECAPLKGDTSEKL
jgi:hypothetical protein